ncbi:DUF1648 domain-containing protein [Streptomyces sp. TRM70308]|uniref:DUF1648 domain-containing protein n=1 Tax=Streptomyces sp. TRM70308 TaxID=3131932 RepID=UPI003D038476
MAAGTPRWRRTLVAGVPFAVAVLGFLVVYLAVRDRLPDVLATHMGSGGRADDFQGHAAFLATGTLLPLALGAMFGAIGWYAPGSGAAPRLTAAFGAGLAAFVGYLSVLLVLANVDVADPRTVVFQPWHLAVASAAALAAGGLGWALAGADPGEAARAQEPPPPQAERLPLADGETVTWARTVHAPALWLVGGLGAAGAALPALAAGPWLLAPAGVLACAVLAFARVHVTVDARGLTVRSALLPRPRAHVPLNQVAGAGTERVNALGDFGGWGYRARSDRSGVIMRSGDALAVVRASGQTFLVTVDDAATAAATLNALADRARRGG